MAYKKYTLPEYPQISDMWEELKEKDHPVVVYGMGNGADKLFDRLAAYGITPAAVFASDGFVRGHSYRGMRVLSFGEVRERFSDFTILLSFATRLPEVIDQLRSIDEKYDMYVPDMPVAGEDEYFDRTFYNEHYEEIRSAYDALADDESKNAFCAIIRYKLSGRMEYLLNCHSTKDEMYSLLPCEGISTVADLGAYNGDTLKEAREYFPSLAECIAVEPDPRTFRRLERYVATVGDVRVRCIRAAVSDVVGEGVIRASGNRNSTVSATASHEYREEDVPLITLDSLNIEPDYIKYDVEGEELAALIGSDETICRCRPSLLVSLYHRSRDIFALINYLAVSYPDYRLYLRRLFCLPAWEINLILT